MSDIELLDAFHVEQAELLQKYGVAISSDSRIDFELLPLAELKGRTND